MAVSGPHAASEKGCTYFSMQPMPQKVLLSVLSIIVLAGTILAVLSVVHYLPPIGGYVSGSTALAAFIALVLVACARKAEAPPAEKAKTREEKPPLLIVEKSEIAETGKTVSGTGSLTSQICVFKGVEYVVKKDKVAEFYAGRLKKLILGDHAPEMIFIKNEGDSFSVGSQYEASYQEILSYYEFDHKTFDGDKGGLAKIVVGGFFMGDCDLKGLASANSNIGIVGEEGAQHYFNIDHEQAFLFGGEFWRERYVIDADWENKLWEYCKGNKLDSKLTKADLKQAAHEIGRIPTEVFEKECDLCEQVLQAYPEKMNKFIIFSAWKPSHLWLGGNAAPC